MKTTMRLCSFCLFIFSSHQCYSQVLHEQVTTLPNGVVVHPAIGNEGMISENSTPVPTVITRTVSEWSLAECLDALQVIEEKCLTISQQECLTYDTLKNSIQLRIQELNH